MRLHRLTLTNFKGVRELTFEPEGKNANVYGDNATGKTTLSDAIHWLFFDKDSSGRKDFAIKTTDKTGEAIHNLEHIVEADIDVSPADDYSVMRNLRKVYHETWTKKRGQAHSTFTGHSTDYFVDGVPVPLKEYKAAIAEIADEEAFRLLTNPAHFNSLHWEDRRRIVLEVAGDISDEDVIASDKKLARLPDVLGGRKLEDQKKVLAARRKEINDELGKIPVRIAEVERGLPDKPHAEEDVIAGDLAEHDAEIDRLASEIAKVEAGGHADLAKRKAELEAEILAIDNEATRARNIAQAEADAQASKHRGVLSTARDGIDEMQSALGREQRSLDDAQEDLERKQTRMADLREEWKTADARAFPKPELDTVCPACDQPLPPERIQAAIAKAEAEHNRLKAEELERINSDGRKLKAEAAELEKSIAAKRETIAGVVADIDSAKGHLAMLEAEEAPAIVEPTADPQRAAKAAELTQVEAKIAKADDSTAPRVAELQAEKDRITAARSALASQLEDAKAYAKGKARVAELSADEKRLASEFESLEADLFLVEEFVRTKVALLEDRINAHFLLARFRLFEEQINGGITECCETLVNGVPYSKGLNNAAQIAVGLDIIETLSRHYNQTAPIFLDNAEAITTLPPIGSQLIALYVSTGDESLRVERA